MHYTIEKRGGYLLAVERDTAEETQQFVGAILAELRAFRTFASEAAAVAWLTG